MEKQQLLRDPAIPPSNETISAALGSSHAAYSPFVALLPPLSIHLEWRYYNDGKSWLAKGLHRWTTSRGTEKEKTVFWLSVWDGFFRLSFFITEKHRSEVLSLPLSDVTKNLINSSKQMGKLKFFPLIFDVDSEEFFPNLKTLITFQKTAK